MEKEFVYFGDPMCSWCWGFSPVIQAIHQTYGDQVPLTIVLGGLHAYDSEPMSESYKATIRHHWEDVNRATGAEFDYAFFDRKGFVLDTEPACRGVVVVRSMKPEATLAFYESVSHGFYAGNRDTTSVETLSELAADQGVDAEAFAAAFESDDMRQATRADFEFAKSLGVTGFPTVAVREDDRYALLTAGYRPFEALRPVIEHWLGEAA